LIAAIVAWRLWRLLLDVEGMTAKARSASRAPKLPPSTSEVTPFMSRLSPGSRTERTRLPSRQKFPTGLLASPIFQQLIDIHAAADAKIITLVEQEGSALPRPSV
jgi:hypothetical protein